MSKFVVEISQDMGCEPYEYKVSICREGGSPQQQRMWLTLDEMRIVVDIFHQHLIREYEASKAVNAAGGD